jgi:ketosteroid isomerase-like protein
MSPSPESIARAIYLVPSWVTASTDDGRPTMYKAAVRWMIRRNIAHLNEGNYAPALAMFAEDATLTFPGDNTWARQYHEPGTGRDAVPTHRGRAEIEGFLRRYVDHGLQMRVEEIFVNGPPWNLRVAVCVQDWASGPDGRDLYANRAVLCIRSRWGRITAQEDYEDTERSAAFDRVLAASSSG